MDNVILDNMSENTKKKELKYPLRFSQFGVW